MRTDTFESETNVFCQSKIIAWGQESCYSRVSYGVLLHKASDSIARHMWKTSCPPSWHARLIKTPHNFIRMPRRGIFKTHEYPDSNRSNRTCSVESNYDQAGSRRELAEIWAWYVCFSLYTTHTTKSKHFLLLFENILREYCRASLRTPIFVYLV